jgi:hypothetical protein
MVTLYKFVKEKSKVSTGKEDVQEPTVKIKGDLFSFFFFLIVYPYIYGYG